MNSNFDIAVCRPNLDKHLDSKTFLDYYWLKEELVSFCRKYNLPT